MSRGGLEHDRAQPAGLAQSVHSGELAVTAWPRRKLVAYGLGSCVAVAMAWGQRGRGVVGLAHVQLPEARWLGQRGIERPFASADRAVPELLRRMRALAEPLGLVGRPDLWLIGGASLQTDQELFNIGAQNAQACLEAAKALGLNLRSQDVGGAAWRSVELAWPPGYPLVYGPGMQAPK
jgi:chemotaxis receptor (MCP) glutamine deamidase CheD